MVTEIVIPNSGLFWRCKLDTLVLRFGLGSGQALLCRWRYVWFY